MLLPIEDKGKKREASSSILLMSGKELLNEVKKEKEMKFVVVKNLRVILTGTSMEYFPIEI
jgi:CO dehydrogenase/acetyl-CoA synthase epsilon subunit